MEDGYMKICNTEETPFNWIFVKENLILDQGMYIPQFCRLPPRNPVYR